MSEQNNRKGFRNAIQKKMSTYFQRHLKKKKKCIQMMDEVDGAVPVASKERSKHKPLSVAQGSSANEEIAPALDGPSALCAMPSSASECNKDSAGSVLHSSPDTAMTASYTNDSTYVDDDCSLCHARNTEYMVHVFLRTLKRNLNVKEVLPYLHYIDHNDAITLSETVPRELAVQCLIDKIMKIEGPEERNKWTTFLVALEKTGYTYLHQLLTGETEIDHRYANEILKIMTPGLISDIHLDTVIDRIIETGLINEEDHDEIKSAEKNRGTIAATRVLLQKVDKRKTNWDTEFADLLEEAGMTHIASVFKMVEHHTHKYNPKSKPSNRKFSKCNTANRKCSIHNEGHMETAQCMRKTLTENPDVPTSDRNKTARLSVQVDEVKQELMNVNIAITSLKADVLDQRGLMQQIDARMKTMTDCLCLIQEHILSPKPLVNAPEIQHDGQEPQ